VRARGAGAPAGACEPRDRADPCSAPPRAGGGSLSGAFVRRWVHAACDALDEASILAISLCAAAPYLCPKHRPADHFTLPGGEGPGVQPPCSPGSPEAALACAARRGQHAAPLGSRRRGVRVGALSLCMGDIPHAKTALLSAPTLMERHVKGAPTRPARPRAPLRQGAACVHTSSSCPPNV
jgi:hypothetical protein